MKYIIIKFHSIQTAKCTRLPMKVSFNFFLRHWHFSNAFLYHSSVIPRVYGNLLSKQRQRLQQESNTPFTLLHFCIKTERKISVSVKPFSHCSAQKRTKTELFESALQSGYLKSGGIAKRCGSVWTYKNWNKKNAAIATTNSFTHCSPKPTLQLKRTRPVRWSYKVLLDLPFKQLLIVKFLSEMNVQALALL